MAKKITKKVEKKKYFLRDEHDRFFNQTKDGFDLVLKGGVAKEVSKEIAEVIKKKYSYIEVKES